MSFKYCIILCKSNYNSMGKVLFTYKFSKNSFVKNVAPPKQGKHFFVTQKVFCLMKKVY